MYRDMKHWLYDFNGWNEKLFLIIYQITNSNWYVMYVLQILSTIFTVKYFIIYYSLSILISYYQIRSYNDNIRYKYFSSISDRITNIGISYIIFLVVYKSCKRLFGLPRPYCSVNTLQLTTAVSNFTSYEECYHSMPSGHTGLLVLIVIHLWQQLNKVCKLCSALLVILVAISRIALAMHYPADVIYACCISTIIALTTQRILKSHAIEYLKKLVQYKIYNRIY